ncbi:MAG: hypothetical protein KJ046_17775, partial [Anaerolineae bacterium]|nr:hypothetical protein [Anaerolineae bacterium]
MTVHDSSPSAERGHRDWLAALLLRQPDGFMARLATGAARWRALSRNSRRRWQRKVAATAAGAALILAMAGSSLLVPAVHAATITVDGTCTLVDAIRAANTNAVVGSCAAGAVGADTIDLQVDTTLTAYAGNYIGYTGLPAVTSEITIEGNGHTIERDGAAPAFRILYVGPAGDLTLNDVNISGGYDFTNAGGGFFVSGGMLTLNNSTVSNNEANFVGGGGFNGSGTLIITDSVFSYNTSYRGGGIYIDYSGAGTVTTLTTITGSLFEKNTATGHGGAIYMDKGELNIIDTAVIDNEAAYDGGGLKTYYPEALVTITGSTFANNSARQGGGMLIREGDVTLINSTLSGNRANSTGEGGGGVYNQNGSLELVNSTVTDNYAFYYGGGIVQMNPIASTTISRSIISGNIAVFGDANEIRFLGGALITGDHNVFGRGEQTNAAAFTGFSPGGTDVNANSDAGNIPLADILDPTLAANGGPTMTHNLVAGSPALDMAPDADCVAPSPTDGLDQRGFVRPFDVAGQGNEVTDTCDAGAVEYLSGPPAAAVFMSTRKPGITSDSLP